MVVGIEVKASGTVNATDFRSLKTHKNWRSPSFFTMEPMSCHLAIGLPHFPFPAYGAEISPCGREVSILTILH